ncbi:MAG TPA: prepilin-type N-terminal cleavage/methylation domain-containing protein [Candidatus Sulfotelmatobacter sp.]|nr:prepilin-type N-terminal cleavage/methylation domain-containing protein [Candidatus Sulfotelmatobacter sp.]
MRICTKTICRSAKEAFTLVEVLIAFSIAVMVLTGVFFAYSQANRLAEFSSMSLAAQSYASQGIEEMRSFQWDQEAVTNGIGLQATNSSTALIWPPKSDSLDVPQTGNYLYATNYDYEFTNESSPPLWELKSVVVWTFPLTHKLYTNTVITLRAPDE